MQEPYEIVNAVLSKHRGLPERIAGFTGRCAELYRSHGRESKTRNPLQSGNLSPADGFMTYCRQFEAGAKGAGLELAESVYAVLLAEFTEGEDVTLAEMHRETTEAVHSRIADKPAREQVREGIEAIGTLARHVKQITQKREILPDYVKAKAVAKNGRHGK